MSTLYELTGQYLEIYNLDMDDETKKDTLDSIDWSDNYSEKVENTIKVIRNLEGDNEAIDAEIKRLQNLKKSNTSKAQKLKTSIENSMKAIGKDKIGTTLFKVSIRRSKSVNVDMVLLPDQFKKVEYKADKRQIMALLKSGQEIAGAELVESENLNIR